MKPAKPITDPTFRYVKAADTDLRQTFARLKWEQEKQRIERERREADELFDDQESA